GRVGEWFEIEPAGEAAGGLRSDEGTVPRSQRGETRRHVGHGAGSSVGQPGRRAALDLGRTHSSQPRVDSHVEPDGLVDGARLVDLVGAAEDTPGSLYGVALAAPRCRVLDADHKAV